MEQLTFRRACSNDVERLRILARNSEAVWGFDETFLQTFDEKYNVTKTYINNNVVYVMLQNEVLVGFWGMNMQEKLLELDFFYIDAGKLRRGYGKRMWKHLMEWCHANDVLRFDFVTSQPAVEFYLACGARLTGTTKSSIDGREIPTLRYDGRK